MGRAGQALRGRRMADVVKSYTRGCPRTGRPTYCDFTPGEFLRKKLTSENLRPLRTLELRILAINLKWRVKPSQ
jgi:hypothetical protein